MVSGLAEADLEFIGLEDGHGEQDQPGILEGEGGVAPVGGAPLELGRLASAGGLRYQVDEGVGATRHQARQRAQGDAGADGGVGAGLQGRGVPGGAVGGSEGQGDPGDGLGYLLGRQRLGEGCAGDVLDPLSEGGGSGHRSFAPWPFSGHVSACMTPGVW